MRTLKSKPFAKNAFLNPDELGFGQKVEQPKGERLMNRDGTFNVRREGISIWESADFYHSLITMSWNKFYGVLLLSFVGFNTFFAFLLLTIQPDAVIGVESSGLFNRFWAAFFLSIQTFTTVGFGVLSPKGFLPNALIASNALLGLLITAISTGIIFTRFSRPTAKFIFSNNAVIAPYRGKTAFMFRLANQRKSQIFEIQARLILVLDKEDGTRNFHNLTLETDKITFLSPHWTVVHPIDEESPLWGIGEADFKRRNGQILMLISGIDDVFADTIHDRTSYHHTEIVWNAKFASMFVQEGSEIVVNLKRLHQIEPNT